METASEQEYKVEVYHDRPVFEAAYFGTIEEARNTASESFGLLRCGSLDHAGRIVETLGRGAE